MNLPICVKLVSYAINDSSFKSNTMDLDLARFHIFNWNATCWNYAINIAPFLIGCPLPEIFFSFNSRLSYVLYAWLITEMFEQESVVSCL